MIGALRPRGPLPRAVLRVALFVAVFQAIPIASLLYDAAWHNTPALRVDFLGIFPHPWILSHLVFLAIWPIFALVLAGVVGPATGAQRDDEGGLAMLSVLGRRGPTGVMVSLGSMALMLGGFLMDELWHRYGIAGEVFNPGHIMLWLSGIFFHVGQVMLAYDLAVGPALGEDRDRRRLAILALLLALVGTLGVLVTVVPPDPGNRLVRTMVGLLSFDSAVGLALAARLWTRRFPASTILLPYVLFRSAVFGLLYSAGYTGAPRPLEYLLVAALAVDLWLLLPLNRARGVVSVLAAGALSGLVWGALGFKLFAEVSIQEPNALLNTLLLSAGTGLLGAGLGLGLAWLVAAWTRLPAPAIRDRTALGVVAEPMKL